MTGDDPQDDALPDLLPDTLARIARTLGVPVAAFGADTPGTAESQSVVAFADGIDDPDPGGGVAAPVRPG